MTDPQVTWLVVLALTLAAKTTAVSQAVQEVHIFLRPLYNSRSQATDGRVSDSGDSWWCRRGSSGPCRTEFSDVGFDFIVVGTNKI